MVPVVVVAMVVDRVGKAAEWASAILDEAAVPMAAAMARIGHRSLHSLCQFRSKYTPSPHRHHRSCHRSLRADPGSRCCTLSETVGAAARAAVVVATAYRADTNDESEDSVRFAVGEASTSGARVRKSARCAGVLTG